MEGNKARKIFTPIALTVLTIAFIGIWASVFSSSEGKLKVSFLNVGQGDSSLIQLPDGETALVDGGPDKKVLEGLGLKLPFYKKKIDVVFLSHPHADHLAGLVYVLERYEVGRVVMARTTHTSPEYEEFLATIKEKHIPVTEAKMGMEIDFPDNVKARILYPPQNAAQEENLNDFSVVLDLVLGKNSFLFTGDLEKDYSSKMLALNQGLTADIIKVPHHGSRDATNEDLYKQLKPKYAVISVGADNKYGHPYSGLLDFFGRQGITYFRTDKDGEIDFSTDGTTVVREN